MDYFTEPSRMDGPMWGLSFEENQTFYMQTLLTILRIPGIFLMDIWWSGQLESSIADIADFGIHLILFVLVKIPSDCFHQYLI